MFKGCFGIFNAYLVVVGLFLPKTEEFLFNTYSIFLLFLLWIIIKFDNHIIKSANVDEGGGWVKRLSTKCG